MFILADSMTSTTREQPFDDEGHVFRSCKPKTLTSNRIYRKFVLTKTIESRLFWMSSKRWRSFKFVAPFWEFMTVGNKIVEFV